MGYFVVCSFVSVVYLIFYPILRGGAILDKKTRVLMVIVGTMSIVLLASNLMATKLWNLFGIPVDGGLLLFPISYVVGDILMEIYGKKVADSVAALAVSLNLIAMAALGLVVYLPPFPGYSGQEAYATIFSFTLRITVGSLVGYLLSQLTNNWVFLQIHIFQDKGNKPKSIRGFKVRAIGSSLVGRFVDNLIFETIGFLGVLPLADFAKQAAGAYIEGLIVETTIVLLISDSLVKAIKAYIATD
ncbi:queuosine precursor transporter [Candidatus Saccharibacteria bacterium]|nr:queuosine precursor transporter [Candidatus Saccharibacteria bacterium]